MQGRDLASCRTSSGVRMLLVLSDPAALEACRDFYTARGCDVEAAENPEQAAGLLRFRRYDLLVANLTRDPEPTLALTELARRRQPSMRRVVLTTANETMAGDDDVVVMQIPQRLDAILACASPFTA